MGSRRNEFRLFLPVFAKGCIIRQVKNQKKIPRRNSPPISAQTNRNRWNRMVSSRDDRGERTAIFSAPPFLGISAIAP